MTQLTIDSVQSDFQSWRASTTKHSKIPEELWDKVLQLLGRYSVTDIRKKLGVSGSQIYKRKQKATNTNVLPTKQELKFMELNIPAMDALYNAGPRFEIKRTDGMVLTMQELSDSTLLQIFTQFMRGI